jgi:hypothetical protein
LPLQGTEKYEVLVFADSGIKDNLLRQFQALKFSVDKKSQLMGMPLRVTTDQVTKSFFEIPLNMWKTNKANVRVTMRFGKDKVIELDESTVSEVEKIVSQLP